MKKIIFLLAATVAIFSACNNSNTDTKTELSLADRLLDEQLYAEAIATQNAEKCAKIAAKDLQKECANVVDALTITEKALTDNDKKICGQIELKRYRENCEAQVLAAIEAKEAKAKRVETDKKLEEQIRNTETKAINNGDPDLCNSIEDENQKYTCRYNVVINRAVEAKDSELCELIGKETVTLECKNLVGNN